jgi:hypothetical protein
MDFVLIYLLYRTTNLLDQVFSYSSEITSHEALLNKDYC